MKFTKILDGWKTAIAAIYWPVVTQIVPIWFPNGLPPEGTKIVNTIGIALTIIGVGHKWYKKTHPGE